MSFHFIKIDKLSTLYLTLLALWLLILLAFFLHGNIHLVSLVALGISNVIFAIAVAIAAVITKWPKNYRGPITARHPTTPYLGHPFGVLGMAYYLGGGFNAATVTERGGGPVQHRPELNNTRKPQSQTCKVDSKFVPVRSTYKDSAVKFTEVAAATTDSPGSGSYYIGHSPGFTVTDPSANTQSPSSRSRARPSHDSISIISSRGKGPTRMTPIPYRGQYILLSRAHRQRPKSKSTLKQLISPLVRLAGLSSPAPSVDIRLQV
jgi:hypothetical protein